MEEKFSFLLFIITLLDLYLNYYNNEFPDYHKVRLYSDIFSLLSILVPIFLILFICCMGCFLYFQCLNNNIVQICTFTITIICLLLVIIFSVLSFIFQIYSIYLYFAFDGNLKIKNIIIKVLMYLTLINICAKIFFSICDFISSLKNKKKENEEEIIELENQE